jgi:hypothetical protein
MSEKPVSGIRRFQFGLGALFVLTALFAVMLAEIRWLGVAWIAITWVVLLPVFWLASQFGEHDERRDSEPRR